uniref:[RNA-polymerase]-subunit kinase n=1 Tax=Oryza meridionalis TaxID=40149 RepID=A0A0E0CL61_9ORYZ
MRMVGIMHQNLKPDNIVISPPRRPQDQRLRHLVTKARALLYTSPVVTLLYRVLELILGSREYDFLVDRWLLGSIMAKLLTGGPLFLVPALHRHVRAQLVHVIGVTPGFHRRHEEEEQHDRRNRCVSAGMKCEFVQEVVAINTREKHFCSLSKISKHLIGTPDIDYLLDK